MDSRQPESRAILDPSSPLLGSLLRDVSRSFHLTLGFLPRKIRPQIGLAYLLARTTDTIADTELVPVEQRLEALQRLRARILGDGAVSLRIGELARHQGNPAERTLLERAEEAVALLNRCAPDDQRRIRDVLTTITSGQELDVRRFAGATEKNLRALATDEELDDYTYRVAGCVGEFWTRMCRAHLFPQAAIDDDFLRHNGVRFGQGLQLVNVLRDLPRDLRQGRCYLPTIRLSELGLAPTSLLDPATEAKLRPLYREYLGKAEAHLAAGWDYTNALPWPQARVRLACAWPILIGMKTLDRLRAGHPLDPTQRIKASRGEVWQVVLLSAALYPCPPCWRSLYRRRLTVA